MPKYDKTGNAFPNTMDTPVGGEGLSKREYFAAAALQGLLTRAFVHSDVAQHAVNYADALIRALDPERRVG